ncbi:MAG: choice-of-anchor B family protein [Vicingaceae bacterium]
MRYLLIAILLLSFIGVDAQTSLNMNLLYQWKDSTIIPSADHINAYNEIWGYEKDGREYAIIGSTLGTHIFDITDINNVDTLDFIPGKYQGDQVVHRDYDTYNDHLYIVCDEGPSSLQIADLSYLPDSVSLVYDSDSLIITSHNIFIDANAGYLYTCGGATNLGANFLSIYSLSNNPAIPQFVINCENDIPFWSGSVGYVHDIYVKNDTAYCNAGHNGLFVVDFSNINNVQPLGSLTSYLQQGYNHSGWLHKSGEYYALADENHGLDIKILDVTDFSDITLIDTIGANANHNLSIVHNLIFRDDNLFVSHYFDGVYVFNTSDKNNISLAGYYNTSSRAHQNNKYEGCWGVYPFLSSGKILASDMQEGLFVFDTAFPIGITENNKNELAFIVNPNPSKNNITVTTTVFDGVIKYSIIDLNGRVVKKGKLNKFQSQLSLNNIPNGVYAISLIQENGNIVTKKVIKN